MSNKNKSLLILFCLFIFLGYSSIPCARAEEKSNSAKQPQQLSIAGSLKLKQEAPRLITETKPIKDIKLTHGTIDIKGKELTIKASPEDTSKGPSILRKSAQGISSPSYKAKRLRRLGKTKPMRLKTGSIPKPEPAVVLMKDLQSPELQRLEEKRKKRKASFEKTLEDRPLPKPATEKIEASSEETLTDRSSPKRLIKKRKAFFKKTLEDRPLPKPRTKKRKFKRKRRNTQ